MGEGEKKDDLFEDLDKFFAPIQDVDWPETTSPAEREEPAGPSEPAAADTRVPEPVASEAEEQEDLFEAVAPAPEAEEEAEGPDSFLYGTQEYETEAEEAGYVELPGETAELEEPEEPEEEPTTEAVEAALEHFAESVREEVEEAGVEPEPPTEPGIEPEEAAPGELPAGPEEVEEQILAGFEEEAARTVVVGAEGLGGPSWQEPTALEIGPEHERRPVGKNVPAAFLTGLVLAAIAIGAIAIGAGLFAIVAAVIVLWAQGELYLAMQRAHRQPATALGLVSGALVLGAGYYRGEQAMLAVFALSVFAGFLWYMAQPPAHRKNTLDNVGLTVLGVAYVPLMAGFALATLNLPDGRGLVLSIVGLTFAYDTAAFVVGYFWGSRALSPAISPKKSWEGAIGATLVVVAVAVGAVAPSVPLLDTIGRSVGLAVVVAIFAPLGDLAESLIKRDLGLKDMGSVLPGHGGVMDRIDSVLFVAPAAFLFLRLLLL